MTAFSEPLAKDIPHTLLDKVQYPPKSPDELVERILRECMNSSENAVYTGLTQSETLASVFAKSVADCVRYSSFIFASLFANGRQGLTETKQFKGFSGYISENSNEQNSSKNEKDRKKEFKAVYDISPETEALRRARDIRDEIKMIKLVFDNQEVVYKDWEDTIEKAKLDAMKPADNQIDEDADEENSEEADEEADEEGEEKADSVDSMKVDPGFDRKRDIVRKLDKEAEEVEKRVSPM